MSMLPPCSSALVLTIALAFTAVEIKLLERETESALRMKMFPGLPVLEVKADISAPSDMRKLSVSI